MPISALDDLSAEHWVDVQNILRDSLLAIEEYDCTVNLVSDAIEVGVIQKRIVHNIYNSDVIVCDVSGKNPNVMFELGMRLAFDKPTVIVKDDKTDYLFDTGVIEHLTYPRSLRFSQIIGFKSTLARKVIGTYEAALSNPEHSTFLKSFGEFQVAKINEVETSTDRILMDMVLNLQRQMSVMQKTLSSSNQKKDFVDVLRAADTTPQFLKEQIKQLINQYILESEVQSFGGLFARVDVIVTMIKGEVEPSLLQTYFPTDTDLNSYVKRRIDVLRTVNRGKNIFQRAENVEG